MERLTFVDEEGRVLFDNPAGFPEDIGFTIRELAENEEWETLDKIAERLANAEQRLQNYENLEEQGLLLKLPCKVGQRVYEIYRFLDEGAFEIDVHKIKLEDLKKIGKTVFLTQAEAEEALRRMREERQAVKIIEILEPKEKM